MTLGFLEMGRQVKHDSTLSMSGHDGRAYLGSVGGVSSGLHISALARSESWSSPPWAGQGGSSIGSQRDRTD